VKARITCSLARAEHCHEQDKLRARDAARCAKTRAGPERDRGDVSTFYWVRKVGTTVSKFGYQHVSVGKHVARVLVYQGMQSVRGREDGSVLILPGEVPQHEIWCAKNILNAVKVTALDVNKKAVEQAMQHGADEGLVGKIDDLDPCRRFDFVNLDTCKLVTSTTGMHVGRAFERAATVCTSTLATWFSYGHEYLPVVHNSRHHRLYERWGDLSDVPSGIRHRLTYIWKFALVSGPGLFSSAVEKMRPMAVLSYPGNRMPMFVVIWSTWNAVVRVSFRRIRRGSAAREEVLSMAASLGTARASKIFGLKATTIAAWRAVKTRTHTR
jgi:hypothetical protein